MPSFCGDVFPPGTETQPAADSPQIATPGIHGHRKLNDLARSTTGAQPRGPSQAVHVGSPCQHLYFATDLTRHDQHRHTPPS